MIITKYKHACFTVEHDNQILVVDPGVFSDDFVPAENIVAVIITHAHSDHFDPEQLANIFALNPNARLISLKEIIDQLPDYSRHIVQAADHLTVGAFELAFFGGQHAEVHSSIPRIANLGVLINRTLYYPGDSFFMPDQPVDILALPAAAPWAKISEAIDFLLAVKPRLAFPTHDAILSETGQAIADQMLASKARTNNITYERIDHQPLDVA